MNSKEMFIEEKLTVYLFLLKIFPNLKGYYVIKEAVKEIIADPTMKFNVTQRLYSLLAQKLGEDEEIIDRAVRHAIDLSYCNMGITYFEEHTHRPFNVAKPSPRELFTGVSELLEERLEKESFKTLAIEPPKIEQEQDTEEYEILEL